MQKKRLVVFFIIILVLGVFSIYEPRLTGKVVSYEKQEAQVIRVIDGDTIETDIGTIRLLGINTPEKGKPHYQDAKDFLLPLENQTVELLRDFDDTGKYGRFLRYVFYENRLLNIEILENGFATAYMEEDLSYEDKLLRAQDYAMQTEQGIWERSEKECAKCIILTELQEDAEPEFFILKNTCNFDCELDSWFVKDASRNVFWLESMAASERIKYESSKHIWNNDGDDFFLRDAEGLLVVYYSY